MLNQPTSKTSYTDIDISFDQESAAPSPAPHGAAVALRVIEKLKSVTGENAETEDEARAFSLKAAELSGIKFKYDKDALKLHRVLMRRKANWMTCLSAWALFLDYRAHSEPENISPWAEALAQVAGK